MNRFKPGDRVRITHVRNLDVSIRGSVATIGEILVKPWNVIGTEFTVAEAIDVGDGHPFVICMDWGIAHEIYESDIELRTPTIREQFESAFASDDHVETEYMMVREWGMCDPEKDDRGYNIRRIIVSHERLRRQLATMTAERDELLAKLPH